MATAYAKLRGALQPAPLAVDLANAAAGGRPLAAIAWDVPVAGTVYGTLLNDRGALAALGEAVHAAPYKAPPNAPILYIKTANTLIADGAPIPLPDRIESLEAGPALGIVIGRTATRVSAADALEHVQGFTILNDVTVPHASLFRPPIRFRCRDGFCPIGPYVVDRRDVAEPDRLGIRVLVNGAPALEASTATLVRPVARLIADVTDFVTLFAGDVLHVGVPAGAPVIRAGDRVRIEIDGIGALENPVVPESELAGGDAR